jgi:tol-pal system protein YbgF
MKATPAFALALVLLAPLPARAANKEHQQLMAEIRMLQEQQAQLQQLVGGLADTLKAINAKMDTQAQAVQKSFADQNLAVNNIGETVRVLREKADDTNVRLSTITQELQALRQTVASMPTPSAFPTSPTGGEPPTGDPNAAPPTGNTAINPPPANISPTRMYDQAYADYTAGQFDLAVEGFQAFIRTFPTSPNADEAQLYTGYSLYAAGKYQEAVAALQRVIADYGQSNSVPQAYFKIGQAYEALKQPDAARRAYETVRDKYPNAIDVATLAKQRLDAMTRGRGGAQEEQEEETAGAAPLP